MVGNTSRPVPKHGYRFVAEVTELLEEGEAAKPEAQPFLRPTAPARRIGKKL